MQGTGHGAWGGGMSPGVAPVVVGSPVHDAPQQGGPLAAGPQPGPDDGPVQLQEDVVSVVHRPVRIQALTRLTQVKIVTVPAATA